MPKVVTMKRTNTAELSTHIRLVVRKIMRGFREHDGPDDLSLPLVSLLNLLDSDGPNSITELARLEHMRPQSMSALASELGTMGLVVGTRDPNDGRSTILSLTQAGKAVLQESRAARQDWLQHSINEKLTPTERDLLAIAIELLDRVSDTTRGEG